MAGGTPAAVNSSHYDANQQPSVVLVSGTLGTADTGGTSLTMPLSGNPSTGAAYVEVLGGTSGNSGTFVNIATGTQQTLGTLGTLIALQNGTISNIAAGVKVLVNGDEAGTAVFITPGFGAVWAIATGTQQTLGTVGTILGIGTLSNLGSVTNIGTIKELTNLVGGTFNAGTVDTELPAAALIGSNTANPTVPGIQAFPMLWDGSNWQRVPGDINGGMTVRSYASTSADIDTIANTAQTPQSSDGNPLYSRTTLHALNSASTWGRVRDANAAANTVGTGLLGVGIQGQDSGGTYHNIAVSTGGSIGTVIVDTELPAAAALADAAANPTTPMIGANNLIWNGATWDRHISPSADGQAVTGNAGVVPIAYNAFNYDRLYNNTEYTVLSSAARAANGTSGDQTNYNFRGITAVLDLTGTAGANGTVQLAIQGKDSTSGKYYTLFTGGAVSALTTNPYKLYPGITNIANVGTSDVLPRLWRIVVTRTGSGTQTYSVGMTMLV